MRLQLATFPVFEDKADAAFAVLITSPLLAGLLLLFLVFVALRLMDRERDDLDRREIDVYNDWARLAATGILFSLAATVASFGWLSDWWGVFGVVATLYFASIAAVVVLTVSVLRRTGVI